jgi:c-di-GMP-binding flagellar brake protein YcgR
MCGVCHSRFPTAVAESRNPVTSPDLTTRLATSGHILVRSGIEIDRVLASMMDAGVTVSATLPSKALFLSRLLVVDPVKQFLLLACSDHKAANSEILAARSIVLRCNYQGAQWAFSCGGLQTSLYQGRPVIQGGLPTAMLAAQPRRNKPRSQVPAQVQLDCVLVMGLQTFDARLIDVSLDGSAFLVCEDPIPLCAGTHLKGARIHSPDEDPVVVDIDVRHVIPAVLANGRRAVRIACRLIAAPDDLEQLIRLFIVDLQ